MLLLQARLLFRLRTLQPEQEMAEKLWGHSPAGLFGYSHLLGGYAGGQAEYLRVPYADVGPIKVPDGPDATNRCCFCPTSSRPATWPPISAISKRGDTVAVWGCGPVGQFAIRSAFLLGAERVIAIDTVPERLAMAQAAGADHARLQERGHLRPHPGTDQRARRRCLHRCRRHRSRHEASFDAVIDRVKVATSWAPTGRTFCGRPSIAAATSAPSRSSASMAASDKIPMGSAINRGLTFRMAQTPVQHYLPQLLERSRRARSILRSSSRIARRSKRARSSTRRSATSRTAASRSCMKPDGLGDGGWRRVR